MDLYVNKWIGNWHVKVSFNVIFFFFLSLSHLINQKSLSHCECISCTRNSSFKYLLRADVKSTLQCSRCFCCCCWCCRCRHRRWSKAESIHIDKSAKVLSDLNELCKMTILWFETHAYTTQRIKSTFAFYSSKNMYVFRSQSVLLRAFSREHIAYWVCTNSNAIFVE